ncbi:metallophosphoesterase [Pseudoponticoccus marisrubri]|uniref:Metallophosphoesterase n=1 Tax=Pseudoponticoccus marisrubri TaxID=1685382 RepID=A0A0W7WM90_9RHOB|nr:metallophosphoesterase [Pseudoponticoccus marisrubri]
MRDPELRERLQSATRTALTRIVDAALDHDVAAVLIAGDLFDGTERSARTAAFLTQALDRLDRAGIRVFYIKGNHDAENPITGEIALPGNVHVFDGRGGKVALAEGIWIHGVSFAQRHAPDSLLPKFPAPVPGAVNVALLHSSLAGAAGHDVYAPCTVGELTAMGFDYWALGHVHARQVHRTDPWIVMPGMPQGRDIGEAGPKTATLIEIGDGIAVSEIPTSAVEFLTHAIDIGGEAAEDDAALRQTLRAALHDLATGLVSDTGVLRLRLTGAPARRWQILRDRDVLAEQVADMARDTGRLWLDRLELDLAENAPEGAGATDALARLMQEIRAEPGFHATARAEVETVLAELPQARRAALMPDSDALDRLAQEIATRGAEAMVARMKGTGS